MENKEADNRTLETKEDVFQKSLNALDKYFKETPREEIEELLSKYLPKEQTKEATSENESQLSTYSSLLIRERARVKELEEALRGARNMIQGFVDKENITESEADKMIDKLDTLLSSTN